MRKTVSFVGTVSARSKLTLVAHRISTAYKIKRIRAKFGEGNVNALLLRFFHSLDDEAPTDGAPNGISLLADYGQVDYIVGNADDKDMDHEVFIEEAGGFLKVYADNQDYFEHLVDVQIYIVPVPEEE